MTFSAPLSQTELNKVFVQRDKRGGYTPINNANKLILLEEFKKNPYPNKLELENLAKKHELPSDKIRNFFKYQRKLDFSNKKEIIKIYKKKHIFERMDREILEESFRMNNKLDDKTLDTLHQVLKCSKYYIKRWFAYRNKKLSNIKEKIAASFLNLINFISSETNTEPKNCFCFKTMKNFNQIPKISSISGIINANFPAKLYNTMYLNETLLNLEKFQYINNFNRFSNNFFGTQYNEFYGNKILYENLATKSNNNMFN